MTERLGWWSDAIDDFADWWANENNDDLTLAIQALGVVVLLVLIVVGYALHLRGAP